jgi:hypothetical protein
METIDIKRIRPPLVIFTCTNIVSEPHMREIYSYIQITRYFVGYILAPDKTYEAESQIKMQTIKTMGNSLFLFIFG